MSSEQDLLDDPGFAAAMASIWDEPTHTQLIKAAIQFLTASQSLHKVEVDGAFLDRKEVAQKLARYVPPKHGT